MNVDALVPPKRPTVLNALVGVNLIVALPGVGIGLLIAAASLLGVHAWPTIASLILAGACGLLGLSGLSLLRATPSDRVWKATVSLQGVAMAIGLIFCLGIYLSEWARVRSSDPELFVVYVPTIITLFGLVEAIYFWRVGSSSRPA